MCPPMGLRKGVTDIIEKHFLTGNHRRYRIYTNGANG